MHIISREFNWRIIYLYFAEFHTLHSYRDIGRTCKIGYYRIVLMYCLISAAVAHGSTTKQRLILDYTGKAQGSTSQIGTE